MSSKIRALSKRRDSESSSSSSPSTPSTPLAAPNPSASSGDSTPTLKVSSPLNPSPKISAKDPAQVDFPQGIQPSASESSGNSSGGGVISSTSKFFRERARSISSSMSRERSSSNSPRSGTTPPLTPRGSAPNVKNPSPLPATSILPASSSTPEVSGVPDSISNMTLVPLNSFPRTPRAPSSSPSKTPRNISRTRSPSPHSPRSRSRSPAPGPLDNMPMSPGGHNHEHPMLGLPSGWWDRTELALRPWRDGNAPGEKGKRKATGGSITGASPEQAEGYDLTRRRVAVAARSVLGTSLDLTHEALLLGVEFLELAPVPGLQAAARTLLNVWDTLQRVDMNRMACLRLTTRCADILISVRTEVHDAGDEVGDELAAPVAKLVESFDTVYKFLQKQSDRPFLKRYLKRDEILRQIAGCDASLSDSISQFNVSIQIRILKQVQALNSRIQTDSQIHAAMYGNPPPSYNPNNTLGLSPGSPSSTNVPLPPNPTLDEIRSRLAAQHFRENERDAGLDIADLRQLMRTALQTSNDAEMIEVLQVGRDEMPDAIKTLQRALEREAERESAGSATTAGGPTPAVGLGLMTKRESLVRDEAEGRRPSEPTPAPVTEVETGGLERRKTVASTVTQESVSSGISGSISGSGNGSEGRARDTLDREFLECGIDALRRLSRPDYSLPSWTITKYEVDLDEKIGKIGIGYFSSVYKGTWRRRTVAIKVLASTTPRKLFKREIRIWKKLSHPNVIELYGASSASGDPPWFFVCPYYKNGSLVTWLKGMKNFDGVDALRSMHQIAKGMEYLHKKGVLHGDLKAANVLVADNKRCLVCDFGQSEMRSEAYRLSGTPPPHGTLRWQAPEMMGGHSNILSQEIDVYAFAITCVEVLDNGVMPWQHQDDDAVVRFVLQENQRPRLPNTRVSSPELTALINACWDRDTSKRPTFKDIAATLQRLRGVGVEIESPRPPQSELWGETAHQRPSPDMRPIPLPGAGTSSNLSEFSWRGSPSSEGSFATALGPPDVSASPGKPSSLSRIQTQPTLERKPERVLYTPSNNSSQSSSLFDSTLLGLSDLVEGVAPEYDGYDSPPPANDLLAEIRNERRYRLLLTHEFHPSLTLPLWTPVVIKLGDIGYLNKLSGKFVTLFNAFEPAKSSNNTINLPSVYGYGRVNTGDQRQDKRSAAMRGLDALAGLLQFKSYSQNISRRYSYQLRDGHKTACLCVESTRYRYMDDLDAPKKWFRANVDTILDQFGAEHHITKEDLFLIIGALDANDWAIFVSHKHPSGQVHFNVYSSAKTGQDWGTFTVDTEMPPELGGPSYHEEIPGNRMSANKVSKVTSNIPWDSVLLARLRFKPDVSEPTST